VNRRQRRRAAKAASVGDKVREASSPEPRAWLLLDRIAHPAAMAAILLVALLLAAFPIRSDDLFMHLAVGRWFFENGELPDPDPWLHSLPGYHRGYADVWASHLGAYALYSLGGFVLLSLVKVLLVALGAAAPFWLARRLGLRSGLLPLMVLAALWAAADRFIARSSLLSDVLGAWTLALVVLELVEPSRKRWLLLPGLFLVWTNFHLGVVTGLFFLGAAALSQPARWRHWGKVLGSCLLASCIHPMGPKPLVSSVQNIIGGGFAIYRENYFEFFSTFHPLYKDTIQVQLFVALLVCMAALVAWSLRRAPRSLFGILVLGGLAYLGLTTIRFVTTASLALPVLAVWLLARPRSEEQLPGLMPGRSLTRASALLAAAVFLLSLGTALKLARSGYQTQSGPRKVGLGLNREVYPFGAASVLGAVPLVGNVFNEHALGAFLAWQWNGKPKLHYHGYVLRPRFYARDYLGVNASPEEFTRVTTEYRIDAFLLAMTPATPSHGPILFQQLLTRPEWRLIHWDDVAVVFLRERPEYREVIETRGYRFLDPFRRERLETGLRTDPGRVFQEAVQLLGDSPRNGVARRVLEKIFRQDPDKILGELRAGRRPTLPLAPPPPPGG
jgi:hypothetical protein